MEGKADTDTDEFLDTETNPPAVENKRSNFLHPDTEVLDNNNPPLVLDSSPGHTLGLFSFLIKLLTF